MALSNATRWRRRLASCIAPTLKGRCLTTLLQIEIDKGDPAYSTVFVLLDSWMHIISDGLRRKKANLIWPKVVAAVTKKKEKDR